MPAGPPPTTTTSAARVSATRPDLHALRDGGHTRALLRDAIDRNTTLVADAHATERAARLATYGSTERPHIVLQKRDCNRDIRGCAQRATIHAQLDCTFAH